ncbi:MAG: 50S ribosomal protein L11 methyltransferase [Pyramidobacter sp.]|nr:50S ribosomal protein L11 methyltransferase [Pyramidobacter sp.]
MPKTDDFWWYITLSGPAGMEDALSSVAEDSGCIGSLTTSRGDSVDLQVYYRANQDLGEWLKVLNTYLEPLDGVTISDMGKIENRPWHTEWMDAFPPLNVGEHLVVMAPWHAGKEESGRLPVFIYPGSAFGTGYHQSTQAVLTLLERYLKKGDAVADIGCGSAILSIAALKMGAAIAYARDLDPSVVDEAVRNTLELNGLPQEKLDIAVGDLLKGFDHKVDLLMANILFEPNKVLLPDVAAVLNDGGRAIFSGMVNAEGEQFKALLEQNGLRLIDEVHFDDWCGLAAEKI